MEFINFFYFPNQFQTILEILQYTFCLIMYHKGQCPALDEIHLIPNNKKKRHVFFKIHNDYIYAPIPAKWDIVLKIKKSKHAHCPYRSDHQFTDLLSEILGALTILGTEHKDFKTLHNLFSLILKEFNFKCDFCQRLSIEKSELGFPLLYIDKIYTSLRNASPQRLKEDLNDHVTFSETIARQIRNETLKEHFFKILFNTYFSMKNEFERSLLMNESVTMVYQNFSHTITDLVLQNIPFLQFKNISFEKWFKSLFLFELDLQKRNPLDEDKKNKFCSKTIALMYYLFREECPVEIEPISFIYRGAIQRMKLDRESLYAYHPLLRGNVVHHFTTR